MPVKPVLDLFVYTLESYSGNHNNYDDLIKYEKVIQHELESLDVIQDPSTITNITLEVLFEELINSIVFLTSTYQKYNKQIKDAVNHFGIDQNVFVMIFCEWYVQYDENGE